MDSDPLRVDALTVASTSNLTRCVDVLPALRPPQRDGRNTSGGRSGRDLVLYFPCPGFTKTGGHEPPCSFIRGKSDEDDSWG